MFKQITPIIILYIAILAPTYVFAGTMLGPERIEKNTTFTKSKSPYIIQHNISIKEGAQVTIENGATLVFDGGSLFFRNSTLMGSSFNIDIKEGSSSYVISGDAAKIDISGVNIITTPRSFLSVWNNSTVDISNLSIAGKSNLTGIQIFSGSKLILKDSSFYGFTRALDIFNTSHATVTDSVFDSNHHAVYTFDSTIYARKNDFV
jgi:hypothetical protein